MAKVPHTPRKLPKQVKPNQQLPNSKLTLLRERLGLPVSVSLVQLKNMTFDVAPLDASKDMVPRSGPQSFRVIVNFGGMNKEAYICETLLEAVPEQQDRRMAA